MNIKKTILSVVAVTSVIALTACGKDTTNGGGNSVMNRC